MNSQETTHGVLDIDKISKILSMSLIYFIIDHGIYLLFNKH